MKCEICKRETDKLYTFFDHDICKPCREQAHEDMDITELKSIVRKRGNIWVTNQLNKLLTQTQ